MASDKKSREVYREAFRTFADEWLYKTLQDGLYDLSFKKVRTSVRIFIKTLVYDDKTLDVIIELITHNE